MAKTSEIKLVVQLDEDNMPEKIEWEATDSDFEGKKPAKTVMLSLWDDEEKMTYSIDIWTKDMLVNDMNIHFHQIFLKMADTFESSTSDKETGTLIRKFCDDFANKLQLKTE